MQRRLGTRNKALGNRAFANGSCPNYTSRTCQSPVGQSAAFHAEVNRESDGAAASRSAAGRKLATIGRQIDGIVGDIAEGIHSSSLASKLASLETERDEIKGLLDALDPMPVQQHPDLAALCRAKVATLATALGDEELRTEAFQILRSLIDAVVLHPCRECREKGGGARLRDRARGRDRADGRGRTGCRQKAIGQ